MHVIVRLLCDHAVDANWLLLYLRAVGWNHTTRAARGGFEVGKFRGRTRRTGWAAVEMPENDTTWKNSTDWWPIPPAAPSSFWPPVR
jgi:hypothetical protein